ncbi:MAG: hypothetical protein RLZZ301_1308 [Bacteroidota bacterium]|jgi:heptosyltransferase-2
MKLERILIIQTAFLGDVILASPIWENLKRLFPNSQIDVVVKKGNEHLLDQHPLLQHVYVFDKRQKLKNLWRLGNTLRANHYDLILNLQRFASSGLLTILANGKQSRGFQKNPLSFFYSKRYPHQLHSSWHEVDRNLQLIADLVPSPTRRPRLVPTQPDLNRVQPYQTKSYYCLAPTSVWFTKQAPEKIWLQLIEQLSKQDAFVYLLGAPSDKEFLDKLRKQANQDQVINLAGELSLLQSAALMQKAQRNYVNDSGPLHLASAMNAPVTAFFCSTVPEFGFGPLSDDSNILEVKDLACRPCGLHGHPSCPKGHFNCGNDLKLS